MIAFIKNPWVIIALIVIVGGVAWAANSGEKGPTYETVIAERGELRQEVSVTGRVVAAERVDLGFERSGRVASIRAMIDETVTAGQIVATLENNDLVASLRETEANLEIQQIKLAELLRGTRQEEINVKTAELQKAEQDLMNYYDGVADMLGDALTTADDAVRTKTSAIFSGSKNTFYSITFTSCDPQADTEATSLRLESEQRLNNWNTALSQITSLSLRTELDNALLQAREHLLVFKTFLERTNDTLTTGCTLSDASFDAYRTNVSTARTNIANTLTSISNLQQSIASQKVAVAKIQNELELLRAGSTTEQIAAQEAQVKQAQANVQNSTAQLAKTILRAPLRGTITRQEMEVGEIVAANTAVISIISEAGFKIEANIPEADIAKIKVNDPATVTLDAYRDDSIFHADVTAIEPAETIIEGVATYKTTLNFTEPDERIRSGMTANIDILTAIRENIIAVPQRAVIVQGTTKTVRLLENGKVREAEVETGLRGSDGRIEINKGVNEGDEIITFVNE